jgi:hypothetical protein
MTAVAPIDWAEARGAVEVAVGRLGALLRSVDDPAAPALGQWSVAEVATHLSHAFAIVPALALPEARPFLDDLWEQPAFTVGRVADDAERDLGVLADLIEVRAGEFLRATGTRAADDPCPWLVEGATVPLTVLTCHLLNEAVMHGYDIAKADRKPWSIDRAHAALILEGFLVPVFQALDPKALVNPDKVAGVRARYDIRLRGASRFSMVFADAAMTVEGPSTGKVDCHLSVDPAAFLLVAWGRISQWQAIPRGQLLAWGRRPWMGLRLRGLVRNP